MKRADAIALIRIAGYHEDKRAFVRLYTENRVSFDVANDAYRRGQQQKANGLRCTCKQCNAPKPLFA